MVAVLVGKDDSRDSPHLEPCGFRATLDLPRTETGIDQQRHAV
jgi:hypothetical protein